MRESPAARGERLLTALEELGRAEAIAVAADDFEALAELQQRAGSLLGTVSRDAALLASPAAQACVDRFRELRRACQESLQQKMTQTGGALRELQASGHRLSRITPAYAPVAAPGGAFTVIG